MENEQMVFNYNEQYSTKVEAMIVRLIGIQSDNIGNLLLAVAPLDSETGEGTGETLFFSINTYGLANGVNYSVGEAFGAIVDCYKDDQGYYDLEKFKGLTVVCFIHAKKSRNADQVYRNILDIFPLSLLQFEWLKNENE